jgi:multiple sugar transport system permease protein
MAQSALVRQQTLNVEERRRRRLWAVIQYNLQAYLFLLPAIILFAMFNWYPTIQGFLLSFKKVDPTFEHHTWVGLENFKRVIGDPLFWISWKNVLFYTAVAISFGYIVPVIMAIAVNEMRWQGYFRLAFYLPVILPAVVTALLWRFIFDPRPVGLANAFLGLFGLGPSPWLQSARTAMLSIWIVTTWAGAGGAMLMYVAALQGIPPELYDAAEIDGANLWQRMWHVTLPQIRFLMLLTLVGQFVGNIQLFTEPFVLTGGGPVNATVTPVMMLYKYGFTFGDYGAASAWGLLMFLFLAAFSIYYMRMTIFRLK